MGFDLRGKGILSQRAHAVVSRGINHNPEKNMLVTFHLFFRYCPCKFGSPLCTIMVYGVDWSGRILLGVESGSLYEIRMSARLLFQQPAFIDPIWSGLGRLPDLEKPGGTDRNPVAMHGGL